MTEITTETTGTTETTEFNYFNITPFIFMGLHYISLIWNTSVESHTAVFPVLAYGLTVGSTIRFFYGKEIKGVLRLGLLWPVLWPVLYFAGVSDTIIRFFLSALLGSIITVTIRPTQDFIDRLKKKGISTENKENDTKDTESKENDKEPETDTSNTDKKNE